MNGKDLIVILSVGGTAVASTAIRSHDIQTDAEVIEKASATQQTWKEYICGRLGWSLTVNYFVLTSASVKDLLYAGQTFSITVKKNGDDSNTLTGSAIMKSVKHTATVGTLAQGSFSLIGTGALTGSSSSST